MSLLLALSFANRKLAVIIRAPVADLDKPRWLSEPAAFQSLSHSFWRRHCLKLDKISIQHAQPQARHLSVCTAPNEVKHT